MPFKSSAQRGYLYANEPEVAKRFEAETPRGKKLPKHVKPKPGGDHQPAISAMYGRP